MQDRHRLSTTKFPCSVHWSWFSYWIRLEVSSPIWTTETMYSHQVGYMQMFRWLVHTLYFTQSFGVLFFARCKKFWREIRIKMPCFNSHLTPAHCRLLLLPPACHPPSFHVLLFVTCPGDKMEVDENSCAIQWASLWAHGAGCSACVISFHPFNNPVK